MNTLDYYCLIMDNVSEIHETGEGMIDFPKCQDFFGSLPSTIFDDGGIESQVFDSYVGIDLKGLCDWLDVDWENVWNSYKRNLEKL